ncbi:hypothetical protein K3M35_24565 [Rhodococcus sp. DMU2021]|uniref:hypothetical protein n=1 Tax=Rhodococcus sp. DMU2021 TaxID=2866997 RepID=UPI001C7D759E|nr:hypothetical protein [Rhodococcus sp. DMU2021]MBX4171771.1 hypothetical protein [Rhodococcus sp. DMU2021]
MASGLDIAGVGDLSLEVEVGASVDEGTDVEVLDGATGDEVGACRASVEVFGAARCAGISVDVGAAVVVVVGGTVAVEVLAPGAGVVVGCAPAAPPAVAINPTVKDATITDFSGESRCKPGKYRYLPILAI